ncbi:MAG TPA: hypothetical protein PLY47_11335 [Rhodoglobus sp.]|nr:hypothetical protein [Rhodoglobus sp.]
MAGLVLDEWQQWCLDEALAKADDGKWSAFEVALIVGRQNGKGSILEARQLAGLFLLHEPLQVHTAHEFKTCFEHFLRIVNLIESTPDFDRRVARIRRGAGEQAIELKTGERLRFLARSGGSGRGMSGDAVYLDEAFALTPAMMGALLPTLSARPNPQVWYTSSAPMATSLVLHNVLERGADPEASPRLFMANWCNDERTDVDDVEAWYRSNPALGIRITEDFIRSELDALRSMPEEFARERLGIPEPPITDIKPAKLPADAWAGTLSEAIAPVENVMTLAFDVSKDGEWSSITFGIGDISSPYVVNIEHREHTGWLPGRLVELVQKWNPTAVGCNGAGPAGAQVGPVLAAFREAGIDANLLHQLSAQQYKQACGGFYTDVVEGRLKRPDGQGPLDRAAADAAERPLGDAWAWDLRSATVPISPLVAATIARALLPTEAEVVVDVAANVW